MTYSYLTTSPAVEAEWTHPRAEEIASRERLRGGAVLRGTPRAPSGWCPAIFTGRGTVLWRGPLMKDSMEAGHAALSEMDRRGI